MNDPVMTIREIADALKLAEKTVYAMASDGNLPAFKIRGQWRLRRVDFDAWLSEQVGAPREGEVPTDTYPSITTESLDSAESGIAETSAPTRTVERAVEDLTERVTQEELHRRLVGALGPSCVKSQAPWGEKPFEMDLISPLPQKVRVYMYNATRPPGGRPLGEHKVQLIVPG